MSDSSLISLLESVPGTYEIVISRTVPGDGLLAAWRAAGEDARDAYAGWCDRPGALAHAAYLAAVDQADAAAEVLRVERDAELPAALALA